MNEQLFCVFIDDLWTLHLTHPNNGDDSCFSENAEMVGDQRYRSFKKLCQVCNTDITLPTEQHENFDS